MLPSSAVENENLIKSSGATTTSIPTAQGDIPTRDRISLNISVTVPMSRDALLVFDSAFFQWRRLGQNGRSHTIRFVVANGEGWTSDEAYVVGGGLSSPEGDLGTVSFEIVAYKFSRISRDVNTDPETPCDCSLGNANLAVLPNWCTTVDHSGQPGTCLSFDVTTDNSWNFQQLLEATARPPTPRVIAPGALQLGLSYTTLAERNILNNVDDSASVSLLLGGCDQGHANVPLTTFVIPLMYKDPNSSYSGVGEQNTVSRLTVGWSVLGQAPLFL
jgi:hypothetical protein